MVKSHLKMLTLLSFSLVVAANMDDYWGEWHGPANGTAHVTGVSAGSNLQLSWSLDIRDPRGDGSFTSNMSSQYCTIYWKEAAAIQLRSDSQWIYLKVVQDYHSVDSTLWQLDSRTGARVWHSPKMSHEDISNPRDFQLYNDPRGFSSVHVSDFANDISVAPGYDTYRLDNFTGERHLGMTHNCFGSRILAGKAAWKNNTNDNGASWHHGGKLHYWNGTGYVEKNPEAFTLLDHAWDGQKCVLFVLSGFATGVTYERARYLIIDTAGNIVQDDSLSDIHRPKGAASCGYNDGIADTGDIVMKLAVKGDYIYALERTTVTQNQLVRRDIRQHFKKTDSIPLGDSTKMLGLSYAVDDSSVYIQWEDSLGAYSHDFSRTKWKVPTPHRTLYHTYIQSFDFINFPGLKEMPTQTVACDGRNIYMTSDYNLQVRSAVTGELKFDHVFTDLPKSKAMYSSVFDRTGVIGNVMLMPNCIVVSSAMINSKLWAFRTSTTGIGDTGNSGEKWANATLSTLPNPFNPTVRIHVMLPGQVSGTFGIYSANGQSLFATHLTGGVSGLKKTVIWDGKDRAGRSLPSGNYFGRLVLDNGRVLSRKLILGK